MHQKLTCLLEWVDARFPLTANYRAHMSQYYAPKNFNFWYYFGVIATVVFAMQIFTGILLVMHYKPDAVKAFYSLEYIRREVPWGYLLNYMHSTGASAFFIVVYLHMFRAMLYGSYRKPRELIWLLGMGIFFALMAEAFFGYLLPWGQMSYWGAQVIVNIFNTIPVVGEWLSIWIRGDYTISDATLNRFFSFHVIALPFVLAGLVTMHLLALHEVGSNNPDGIEIKAKKDANGVPLDGIPFHPYYTVKDTFGVCVFLFIFFAIVFFAPEFGGYFLEYNNFIPANPVSGPAHIAPVWYFTPYYSILRAVPGSLFGIDTRFFGVVAMGASTLVFCLLPWLDRSPVKSIRYRGIYFKIALAAFVLAFFLLGYLGTQGTDVWGAFAEGVPILGGLPVATLAARIGTAIYFAFFVLMPWYSAKDRFTQPPERVRFH